MPQAAAAAFVFTMHVLVCPTSLPRDDCTEAVALASASSEADELACAVGLNPSATGGTVGRVARNLAEGVPPGREQDFYVKTTCTRAPAEEKK